MTSLEGFEYGATELYSPRLSEQPGERFRMPGPAGCRVELVLEVDDVIAERDLVIAAGWPLAEDLQDRPWGLADFRILDSAGYRPRAPRRSRARSPAIDRSIAT
jgi:hypothetical protein